MNTSNRHHLATANLLKEGHRETPFSQDGAIDSSSSVLPLNRSLRAASIYGGVAVGTRPAAPVPAIPQTPPNSPEASTGETTRSAASEVANWSPALQNVLDRPPASFPYRMMLGGMLFCVAFGAWAWLGQIEEVGHARGQLVPKGEVYKVHPVESGKVASISIKEGDAVKAGQVLVELDTQMARGEVERLEQMLASSQIELSQKQALVEKSRLEAVTREAIAQAEFQAQQTQIASAEEKAATAKKVLAQLQADVEAAQLRRQRLEPLAAQTQELLAQQQAAIEARIARVQRLEPVTGKSQELQAQLSANIQAAKERVERLKPLVEVGAIAKEQLFQAEQAVRDASSALTQTQLQEATNTNEQLFQAEQGVLDAKRSMTQIQLQEAQNAKEQLFQADQALRDRASEITQTQGELASILLEGSRLQAELKRKQAEARQTQLAAQQQIQQLQVELTQLTGQIVDTQNLLDTSKAKLKQRFLYAPVDGVVSSLNVSNPGEVVQPGQTIAEMAPHNAPLVLSARLPNSEAGLLETGMTVNVKFDAYPYQDYGIIAGTVTSISPDAKPDEKLGAVYQVEVKLARNYVSRDRQIVPFKAGQTATADIVIRRRRIADLLLEPIRQLQQGGIDL